MVLCAKCLVENCPVELVSIYGLFLNAFGNTGYPISFGLGYILPTEYEDKVEDERWRILLLLPLAIVALQTLAFLTVITQDPYMYSVGIGDKENATKMMMKVFKLRPDDDSGKTFEEAIDEQYSFISKFSSKDSSTTTFGEAVCGSYYRKGTWVCFFINVFN